MRITELLSNKGIELGVKVNSKDEAIKILVGLHNKVGNLQTLCWRCNRSKSDKLKDY